MKFTKDRILHKGEILAKKGEHQMIHPSSSTLQASHGSLLENQQAPPGLSARAISASPRRLRSSGKWCIIKVLSTTSNDWSGNESCSITPTWKLIARAN